ncbi:MAG: HEAT repeat domain-containing protein [Gemmatimonadota bacterium]
MTALMTTRCARGRAMEALRCLPAAVLLMFAACGSNPPPETMTGQQRLAAHVREVLDADWASPEYQEERSRLEEMGAELDPVLVDLIEDRRARTEMRADALVLLADRRSPIAVPMLSRALGYDDEDLRSAAVLGLSRMASDSDAALELIRAATRDRSRTVRLNALQSLDIREVETIRALLERENDPEVRQVAIQLLSLAEARGAALPRDRRGALRTAGGETEAQIVFRPVHYDSVTSRARGDLRLELPDERDIPLAADALVVRDVVPAFFSPDRSSIVVESDDQVKVVDIDSREVRSLGPGLAPRLIPFTQDFVFVRERVGDRMPTAEGTELVYDVYRAGFIDSGVELIGRLRAAQVERAYGGESPVRWMVVSESGEGFVLRGENLEPFPLPTPVWGPAGDSAREPRG